MTLPDYQPVPINPKGPEINPLFSSAQFRDEKALIASIKEVGILEPVWTACINGKDCVVSGQRRISAALALGLKKVPAYRFEDQDQDPIFWRNWANKAHLNSTGFSLAEHVQQLKRLKEDFHLDEASILSGGWMESLGLKRHGNVLADHLSLSELTKEAMAWLSELGAGLKFATRLAVLGPKTVANLQAFSQALQLGPNRIKPLLPLIEEIATRDQIDSESLLEEFLPDLSQEEKITSQRQWERLHESLQNRRYPLLKKLKETLAAHQKNLALPSGIQVSVPPGFESDKVEWKFKAASAEDFSNAIERLLKTKENPSLSDFYKLIHNGLD